MAYHNIPGVAPKVWAQLGVFWQLLAKIDFLGWIEQQQQQQQQQQAASIDGFLPKIVSNFWQNHGMTKNDPKSSKMTKNTEKTQNGQKGPGTTKKDRNDPE